MSQKKKTTVIAKVYINDNILKTNWMLQLELTEEWQYFGFISKSLNLRLTIYKCAGCYFIAITALNGSVSKGRCMVLKSKRTHSAVSYMQSQTPNVRTQPI